MRKLCSIALSLMLACAAAATPAETIQAVVPFPPGGPLDSAARVLTTALTVAGKGTFVVENRAGANGNIGAKFAADAVPDGTTWLFTDGALVTVNPKLYAPDAHFDPTKDLRVVAGIALQPSVLVVNANSRWKTLQDFIAYARTKNVMYASGGNGSSGHLTMEEFGAATGAKLTHVPYRGAAPAMADLLGGQVDAAFVGIGGAIGHIHGGKLRALAVSSAHRVAALPEVPTAQEQGLHGFVVESAYFVMLPAKTPVAAARTIESEVLQVLADRQVQGKLRSLGMEPVAMNAQEASRWLASERVKMAQIIAEKHIKAN